jgi:hypothetical protein
VIKFRLITWFEKVRHGPVRSISFTHVNEEEEETDEENCEFKWTKF